MEALSPRSTNIPPKRTIPSQDLLKAYSRPKPEATKAVQHAKTDPARKTDRAAKAEGVVAKQKAEREKNHASPPPEYVVQPPGTDGIPEEKYRVGRLLGKGGFAICYEGQLVGPKHGNKGHQFALKIVKAVMGAKRLEEKFKTELQIHSRMRHPNIVEFHRAFTFLENTYVVLEICPNGSIMDMVRTRHCLTLPEVRRYAVQICGAIKYMHSRNVIHRDLKMGNVFLDKDMNAKIGDFGLAALLVTEKELKGASRRTTVCGTPNYIAPEILNKDEKGHDHRVDIWALGIILYAMLMGVPPFQSNTQEDIYRKVKALDYTWPAEGRIRNDIPEEAKDLVAFILKVNPDERPDPDAIVHHSFFSMHGSSNIPAAIPPSCREKLPPWHLKCSPIGDVMSPNTQRVELGLLCTEYGVGNFSQKVAHVGQGIGTSLYREFMKEEAAGRTPIIPLPEDFVYCPSMASSPLLENQEQINTEKAYSSEKIPQKFSRAISVDYKNVDVAVTVGPIGHVKGHAAQLRADPRSKAAPKKRRSVTFALDRVVQIEPAKAVESSEKLTARIGEPLLGKLPVRASSASVSSSTIGRSKKVVVAETAINQDHHSERDAQSERVDQAKVSRPVPRQDNAAVEGHDQLLRHSQERTVRAKPISTVATAETVNEVTLARKRTLRSALPITGPEKQQTRGLFSPDEAVECIRGTVPAEVMARLDRLRASIAQDLDNIYNDDESPVVQAKPTGFESLSVVVDWVDYSRKIGISYKFSDGSYGLIFNGSKEMPSNSVLVPNIAEHLKKRCNNDYAERHQIVPPKGSAIEFFEDCGGEGILRMFARPKTFQLRAGEDGKIWKLTPGSDPWDRKRRSNLLLWDKFARYKRGDLSNDQDAETKETHPPRNSRSGTFVKLYQRVGNVAIWGFGNGSFQFNFPDHTKIIISSSGKWAEFYHLSVQSVLKLKAQQPLSPEDFNDRDYLGYPLDVLLNGCLGQHDFHEIVDANELRAKLRFMCEVFDEWKAHGGVGQIGSMKLKWEGLSDKNLKGKNKGEKLEWISVGAQGGDRHVEASAPN